MASRFQLITTLALFWSGVLTGRGEFPYVITAVQACEDAFQLDVTFDEPVDLDSALDPFNYTVFQSASNGAPRLQGDFVMQISTNDGRSFRVLLEHGAFVPDEQSVVFVEYVTDLAGNVVFPALTAVTACPQPRLSITRVDAQALQFTWSTNAAGFSLESTTNPIAGWQPVTNRVAIEAGRLTVLLDVPRVPSLYRLQKP